MHNMDKSFMASDNNEYSLLVMIKISKIEMNNEYCYWNFCHCQL